MNTARGESWYISFVEMRVARARLSSSFKAIRTDLQNEWGCGGRKICERDGRSPTQWLRLIVH